MNSIKTLSADDALDEAEARIADIEAGGEGSIGFWDGRAYALRLLKRDGVELCDVTMEK